MVHVVEKKVWTVAQAKAHLSEVLRLASQEGPQTIGTRTAYVVVPEKLWDSLTRPRVPLGQWLVDNLPRGAELPEVDRHDPERASPFE